MNKGLSSGFGPRIEVASDYAEMSRRSAALIISALKARANLLLCASAGGTPIGTYAGLTKAYKRNPGLFSRLRVLQIDEWGGLKKGSPATCAEDLRQKLTNPLELRADQFTGFRTDAPDAASECARIARWLAVNGPIDLCILGLGLNGHIAMNEPADELLPFAHVATLTESSRKHGMLRGLTEKPGFGFTLGMREILESRQILLLVSGSSKRKVLRRLLQPYVSTDFPASFLWLHPKAMVLCDREAAGEN